MKKINIYLLLVILITSAIGCSNTKVVKQAEDNNLPLLTENINDKQKEKEVNLKIVTTNKSLFYMVKDLTGNRHCVDYMFINEADLWNYTYTEDSTENMAAKDLFIYSGANLEPWIGNFIDSINKNKVGIINASRGIKLLTLTNERKYKDALIKDNPYYWLSVDNYKVALLNVKNALIERDPKNREEYDNALAKALKDIEVFEKRLKEVTDNLKDYTFIVDTDDLDYFIKYTGLKTIKINQLSKLTGAERSAELEKIDKKIKEAKKTAFLYSDVSQLNDGRELIDKYKMKTAVISIYGNNINYSSLLGENIINLQGITPQ